MQVIVGFAISALAIYCLIGAPVTVGPVTIGGQISVDRLGSELTRVEVWPVVVLATAVLVSLVTRAARWQVYFLPRDRVPFGPLFSTLAISYMASTFLPLRAGELVRAVFLSQRARVAFARVVGTILLEKLFDFLAIGVMLILLVALVFLGQAPLPGPAIAAASFIGLVIFVGFAFVVALAVWREPTVHVLDVIDTRLPELITRRVRLASAARQFAEGTDSLRSLPLWPPMLGWTVLTWILSLLSVWAGAASLGVHPGLGAVLFVSILTSTGQAVPSSPGYVGVYHAAATLAWTLFGIDTPTAIAIAVITHAFSYGSLVIMGLLALWTGGYTFGDVLSGISGSKAAAANRPVALAPER